MYRMLNSGHQVPDLSRTVVEPDTGLALRIKLISFLFGNKQLSRFPKTLRWVKIYLGLYKINFTSVLVDIKENDSICLNFVIYKMFKFSNSVESVELLLKIFAKVTVPALRQRPVPVQPHGDLVVVVLVHHQTRLDHVSLYPRVARDPARRSAPKPCQRHHTPDSEALYPGVEHALEVDFSDPLLGAPLAPLPQIQGSLPHLVRVPAFQAARAVGKLTTLTSPPTVSRMTAMYLPACLHEVWGEAPRIWRTPKPRRSSIDNLHSESDMFAMLS